MSATIDQARSIVLLLRRGIVFLTIKQLEELYEQMKTSRVQQIQELYAVEVLSYVIKYSIESTGLGKEVSRADAPFT